LLRWLGLAGAEGYSTTAREHDWVCIALAGRDGPDGRDGHDGIRRVSAAPMMFGKNMLTSTSSSSMPPASSADMTGLCPGPGWQPLGRESRPVPKVSPDSAARGATRASAASKDYPDRAARKGCRDHAVTRASAASPARRLSLGRSIAKAIAPPHFCLMDHRDQHYNCITYYNIQYETS
jgi:hypothetical protein